MATANIETTVKERLAEKQGEIAAINEASQKAGSLAAELKGLRSDLARQEKRLSEFRALGDKHIEVPNPMDYLPGWGAIQLEPFRSAKSGKQLAAETQHRVDHLRGEIAWREKEIEELLEGTR